MARIVEFCGVPGVGKSTLYSDLLSKWKKQYNWIPGHKLYPIINIQYKNLPGFLSSAYARFTKKNDLVAMDNAAKRFIAQNANFIDCCWGNIYNNQNNNLNGVDNRFRATEMWLKIITKQQILIESPSCKIAVVDEGLIQRIDSTLYKSKCFEEEKNEIAEVVEKVKLPMGVIYIDADLEVSIARLKARTKKLPILENLSMPELISLYQNYRTRWRYTFELLAKKGIPVLTIDSTKEVNQNGKFILKYLEELN